MSSRDSHKLQALCRELHALSQTSKRGGSLSQNLRCSSACSKLQGPALHKARWTGHENKTEEACLEPPISHRWELIHLTHGCANCLAALASGEETSGVGRDANH